MFKKTLTALGMIACASLSANSYGAANNLVQTATNAVVYASELFGTGSDATVLTSGANVVLTSDGAIDKGEIADVTFTLSNATFGAAVSVTALVPTGGTGDAQITKQSGGAAGDSSVTFRTEVTAAFDNATTLVYSLPSIKGASALAGGAANATVATSVSLITTNNANRFPESINAAAAGIVGSAANEVAVTSTSAAGNATINVDSRTKITGAVSVDHDGVGSTAKREGFVAASVELTLASAGVQSAGTAFAFTATNDGEGDTTVAVTGTFNTGDIVFVDLDGDLSVDSGESLTITGTSATGTFDNNALESATGTSDVIFVANGTSTLSPADYVTVITTAYDASTIVTDTATSTRSLSFSGLTQDGWAFAIPNDASADDAFIRLTNETNAAVDVFAQGYAQDGTDLGFIELGEVAANVTTVYTSAILETAFGAAWTGRARFDFSTSGNVSVQTMIRSGGVLNNVSGVTGVATTAKTSASNATTDTAAGTTSTTNVAR